MRFCSARPRCVLYLLAIAACCAAASPAASQSLRLDGTLTGSFMTPAGELVTRALPIGGTPAESALEPLHPLWGWRYLRLEVASPRPVQRITLLTPRGEVAWQEELPEPQRRWTIPRDLDETPIALHPRHGFRFSLQVEHADGSSASAPISVTGVRLLAEPPRIDWLVMLDVIRVRDVLRERGEAALSGFHADDVAFALNSEAQMVLIDHPSPPPEFRRYEGPQPIDAVLHMGPARRDPPSAAWATAIGGFPTAVYHRPVAEVAPEQPDPQADPTPGRLVPLIHEACHCAWPRLRSLGEALEQLPYEHLRLPPLEVRLLEILEHEAIARAATAPDDEIASHVRSYLALHDALLAQDPEAAALAGPLEELRTTEGFAQFAAEAIDPQKIVVSDLEHPQGRELSVPERMMRVVARNVARAPRSATSFAPLAEYHHPHAAGLAQATALMRLREDAVTEAWAEDRLLIEQLAREVGYDALPDAEREALIGQALAESGFAERLAAARAELQQGRDALVKTLGAVRAIQAQAIELRVLFSAPLLDAPDDHLAASGPQFLTGLTMPVPEGSVIISAPCLIRAESPSDRLVFEVRTAIPGDGTLFIGRRTDDEIALATPGLRLTFPDPAIAVDGRRITLTAALPEARVPRNALSLREAFTEDGGYLVMPDCSTGAAVAPEEILVHHLSTTVTGVFPGWGSLAYDLRDLNPVGRTKPISLYPRERYRWDVTVRDLRHRNLCGVELLSEGETLQGPASADGSVARASMQVEMPRMVALESIWLAFGDDEETGRVGWQLTLLKEDLQLKVVEQYFDPAAEPPGVSAPLEGATVRAWPLGHEEQAQTQTTDAQGLVHFREIPATRATYEVTHPATCGVRFDCDTGGSGFFPLVRRHFGMQGAVAWAGPDAPQGPPEVTVVSAAGEELAVELRASEPLPSGCTRAFDYSTAAVRAGEYTVTARWGGHESTETCTVADDCQRIAERYTPTQVAGTGGSHSPVRAPRFRFPPE